jgi:serine-type D-Ala-D-Ala carboxypeptidase
MGFILLGCLVELLTGMGLADFVEKEIAAPLGLEDTRYLPLSRSIPADFQARVMPTESRSVSDRGTALMEAARQDRSAAAEWEARHPGGQARGIVHDENAAFLGGVAGNAGLFTTAGDIMKFGRMWLAAGVGGRESLVSPGTIAAATRNWLPVPGEHRCLGWQLPSPDSSFGDLASPECFGHTGFTGTALWVDPRHQLVVALLTNRLQFGRGNERILRIRRLFLNALLPGLRS